jgi:membrane fusion protein (multidrug efflux system)
MAEQMEPQRLEGGGGRPAPAAPQAAPQAPPQTAQGAAKPSFMQSKRFRVIAVAAVVAVAVAWGLYYLHARQYESTDDAQVDGHVHPISARINGTVRWINPEVQENHLVKAGTLLLEIDPADYQAELARARADLDRVRASAAVAQSDVPVVSANATGQLHVAQAAVAEARDAVATERANLDAARARQAQAEATARTSAADLQRYSNLLAKQEISRSEYEQRETAAKNAAAAAVAARADVVAAEQRIAQAQSKVAEQAAGLQKAQTAPQQIAQAEQRSGSASAEVQRAEAAAKTAELNLSYTRITAPVSGIVGRKSVEVGQRVQPGQELLSIIETDDVWVTANFKETQLRLMRPGQPATVHIDAYDRDYPGHVESIGAATGARFSLLPPENASGNFVKVVQRLPVRIRFDHGQDREHPLRPGMSAVVEVEVR